MPMKIGEIARSTRTNPSTVRYYEEIGLMPAPMREDSGQRRYNEEDRRRLAFIRQCRAFGFSIEQIRSLVMLTRDSERSCGEARAIAADHLKAVSERVSELTELQRSLMDFVESCDTACAGGPGPECVILREMADPQSHGSDLHRVKLGG